MLSKFTFHVTFKLLLALIFVVSAQQVKAQDKNVLQAHNVNQPHLANINSVAAYELIEKRSRFSTHYQLQNGHYKMKTSPNSLFYQTQNGWEAIDNTVDTKSKMRDEQHPYRNETNAFKTAYPRQLLSGSIRTELNEGNIEERLEAVYAVNASNQMVYQCKPNACQAVVCADASIAYENIFPHASIKYTQQNDGRKFDLIIQHSNFVNALPLDATHLVIKEKLFLPKHFSIKIAKDGYNIYSGAKWITHLQTPVAYDKIIDDETNQTKGQYKIEMIENEIYLYTTFPIDWMRSSQRTFPLHLDPTMLFYPDSIMFATGMMNTPSSPKNAGLMQIGGVSGLAWATFNISSLPAGANISDGYYHGYHYNVSGPDKKVAIVGMQGVNPISATNTQIATQISSMISPVYDTDYVWGANAYAWHIDTLNPIALNDIASQQGQGWTALGFKYHAGSVTAMQQYGYNASVADKPYLEIVYTLSPCAGMPNPGNTLANNINPCYSAPIYLSLQNVLSLGSGLAFQWYTSAGVITGATNASYSFIAGTTAVTAWCDVICLATGLSTNSAPVTINGASYLNCYCTSSASVAQDEDIFNVTLNSNSTNTLYSFANGCVNVAPGPGSVLNKYSSFMSLAPLANLIQGLPVAFSIEQDECDNAPYFNNTIGIWIDFNHNTNFSDPGELVYMSAPGIGPKILNGVFTAPLTSVLGNTIMRVVCTEGVTPTPCGTYAYGETEDYLINIIGSTPCFTSPTAIITTSSPAVCLGDTCNLSLVFPTPSSSTTYQWYNASGIIAGATNATYSTIINAPDSFYCEIICATIGVSIFSNTINLSVIMPSAGSSSLTSCDLYIWNATTYTSSGTYTQTLVNSVGCDSVHTLNLTIQQSSGSSLSLIGCNSVQYNGVTYFVSGLYTQNFTNAAGCDSIITINATVNNTNIIVANIDACDSILFGGITYYNNATFSQIYINMFGCDSILSTSITIHQSTDSVITSTNCDFYLAGGIMYTTSGNYTQSLSNIYGCDSIMHYNLTINQSTDSLINAVSCNSFSLNGQTYTNSGTYTQSYTNAVGCDSALTLQISVDTLNATITINGITLTTPNLGTYQWIDCSTMLSIPGATSLNFIPTVSGNYAIEVTSGICVDTSICLPLWMTGVNEMDAENMFVFPNPTRGIFDLFLPKDAEVKISNALGEIVLQQSFNKGKHTIDLTTKAAGIYYLKTIEGEIIQSIKLLKE